MRIKDRTKQAPLKHTDAYEAALLDYAEAVKLLQKKDFARALELFTAIEATHRDEAELAERSRTYARICQQQLRPADGGPQDADQAYYRAVLLSNDGRWDEAIELFGAALQQDPNSVRCLYARACAWALKGNADRAVVDLRQAIGVEPSVRFQAVNDPDFEKIREEPAFIDIIEPTPAGA